MIGRTFRHYTITAKLGEGGMGAVYLAEDTKLGREVAVKLLPESLAADPERLERFKREAQTLAALNHPNIVGIYAVEESDGQIFLVMERAEGTDLASRIHDSPPSVEDALEIALQIAQGLETAHDSGIVHRDLKPANVVISSDGKVKVLDFGLAKAEMPGDSGAAELSASPTLTQQMTQAGVILGTAAYMSPEQARGKPVDKRADIWAFGVVMYEMLTSGRLFDGPSVTDVLAAVIRQDIDLDRLPSAVPKSVRDLLARCLDRDANTRLRDIGEARIAIARALEGHEEAASAESVVPTTPSLLRWAPWLIAVAALLLAAVMFYQANSAGTEGSTLPISASIDFPDGVRMAGWSSPGVAISPDERTIAFVGHVDGRQQLYLRHLDQSEAMPVPDSDGAEGPFFSPDGQWVAFGAGAISGRSNEPRMLKRAPISGGTTENVVTLGDYVGGSWGTDGYIYYAEAFVNGWFRRVREGGGEREPVFGDDREDPLAEITVGWPQHIDDGKRVLFTSFQTKGNQTMVLDLESGELTDLQRPATFARYAAGHLFYAQSGGRMLAEAFSPDSLELTGSPVTMVQDVALTANGAPLLAVGDSGTAVFATGYVRGSDRVLSKLVRIDPKDGAVEDLGFAPDEFIRRLTLAPDQRRFVTATWDRNFWVYDLERGTRMLFEVPGLVGEKSHPLWSPDGKQLAFTFVDIDKGGTHVYVMSSDGTETPRLIAGKPGESYASDWTSDSQYLIYEDYDGMYQVRARGEPNAQQLIRGKNGRGGTLSPNQKWITYYSRRSGDYEVYVEAFPDGGEVFAVSTGGGTQPKWSEDGREIYYNFECKFFAVPVTESNGLRLGKPRLLFDHCDPISRRGASFEVDRQGRFYLLEAIPDSGVLTSLSLETRWGDRLKDSD